MTRKLLRIIVLLAVFIGLVATNIFLASCETDSLNSDDFRANSKHFIIGAEKVSGNRIAEPQITTAKAEAETSYEDWLNSLDLWDYGLAVWGISYEDTNRILRLVSYESYGYSPLSYYVACCCWVRVTEGYWGYGNLYTAFGEVDYSYDLWMDELGIADWAYEYVWDCYRNPTYCRYCNGMTIPYDYIYYESGIYCWN